MNIAATLITYTALSAGVAGLGNGALDYLNEVQSTQKGMLVSLQSGDLTMSQSRAQMLRVCVDSKMILMAQGQGQGIDCKALVAAQTN